MSKKSFQVRGCFPAGNFWLFQPSEYAYATDPMPQSLAADGSRSPRGITEKSARSSMSSAARRSIIWPSASTRSHSTARACTIARILAMSGTPTVLTRMPVSRSNGSKKNFRWASV